MQKMNQCGVTHKIAINQYLARLMLLFAYLASMAFQEQTVSGQQISQTFQLSQVSIENRTVDVETQLEFLLQIRRAPLGQDQMVIEDEDYLLIEIPTLTTTAQWTNDKPPVCQITGNAQPSECEIISNSQARISMQATDNLVLHGSISNFRNPHSVTPIINIQASLWNRRGELKILGTSLALYTFEASSLDVALSSSSRQIGAKSEVLTIGIDPWTRLKASGFVIFKMPDYYEGAANDFMFRTEEPTPCLCDRGRVNRCTFDQKEKQLTLKYEFTNRKDAFEMVYFQVGQFNNPLTVSMSGFQVEILDQRGVKIAERNSGITIEGIDQAAQFKSYTFNYVDYSHSGVYAVHQFVLESSIPIQKGCNIRVVYPDDMTVDDQLIEIKGVGFAQPSRGQSVLPFKIIPNKNTIDLVACQTNYGLITLGTITLTKIKNQDFRHTLDDFKVFMTTEDDLNFERIYQEVTEDFNVKASQQKAGRMTGEIVPTSTLVQTTCSLTFNLKTSQYLDTKSFILIYLPDALEFQSKGCTVSKQSGFSDLVFCQREGKRALISRIFDTPKDPGYEFSLTIEMFQMPTSVQQIGLIKFVFIDIRENLPREVDVFEDKSIQSTSGEIKKIKDVSVTSDLTSLMGQTYQFSFKMYHSVPVGGFFSILLSLDEKNGVSITNHQDVQSNCHRVMPDGSLVGLECLTGRTEYIGQPFVNISCSRAAFGDTGTGKEQEVTFRIGGLTNPRIVNVESQFQIQTLDEYYRYIDISPIDENFQVRMTQLIKITAIEVRKRSEVNGVLNDYTIRIIPSIKIYSQDIFIIEFPSQIQLKDVLDCQIGEPKISLLKEIKCEHQTEMGRVKFQILEIDDAHIAGTALEFVIKDVRNPYSTRPTDSFSNIVFTDGDGGYMAEFDKDIILATTEISHLNPLKAGIIQSSYGPLEDSVVSISFETNNPLPLKAAIVIDAPPTLNTVYQQTEHCQIELKGSQTSEYKKPSKFDCQINGSQIILINFLTDEQLDEFQGFVKISFKTRNPVDSQNLQLQKVSYQISLWDDNNLKFGIDKLNNVLFPSITCAYPCQTCLKSNPHYCLTCLPQDTAPQYLHTPIDVSQPNQTCVDACPAHQGFTSNGSRNPKRCVKCADTCQECAQNDLKGDINICTKCKSEFPFLWLNQSTCHAGECPNESYLSNPNICITCGDSCFWCSDRLTCTKCNPFSRYAYLHYNSCIEKCPYGYTAVENVCVPCEDPCETCKFGDPATCTSCDNTGNKQFLFNFECLKECPINTTMYLENRTCVGCLEGCALCDQDEVRICKKCHDGLLLHENKCIETCPFNYTAAPDGSVCEPRIYLLDQNFIPIPFIAGAFFLTGLTLISYWCTAKQSLVSSTIIAFLGPIEMATAAYQVHYSLQDDKKFIPIIIGSAGAFISGILVNVGFLISFNKQVKTQDRQFERWRKQRWCISNMFLALSFMSSLTIYRLSFSRLYSLEVFDIRLNRPKVLLRTIIVFTWIKFFIFNIPLICVDIYGISALTWGNQCHMTMLESMTISFLSCFLMIWETLKRNSLIESDLDQKRKMIDDETYTTEFKGLGKIIPGEIPKKTKPKRAKKRQAISLNQIMFQIQNHVTHDEIKDAELRQRPTPRTLQKRIRSLTAVLDHLRKQRDLHLNNSLDELLEVEAFQSKSAIQRSKSLGDLRTGDGSQIDEDVSEVDSIYSFPGFKVDVEEKLALFDEFKQELLEIKRAENNKQNQWEDPEQMNIYASPRDPPPEVEYEDQHVQTMQEKKGKRGSDSYNADRMAKQKKDLIIRYTMEKKFRDNEYQKQRKKQVKRRGKKFYLMNPLESDQDLGSEESDQFAQDEVPINFGKPKSDMVHSAMNVERNQSLTMYYDLQQQEGNEKLQAILEEERKQKQNQLSNLSFLNQAMGVELSRISGDLDFSDDEDFNTKLLDKDPEAKRLHEKTKIDNIEAWLNEQNNLINLRTFNENDIIGNFERDWAGKIIDEQNTLARMHFKDRDGLPVNQKGYLIDQETGDIISKYTFEVMFKNEDLIELEHTNYKYELPLPYRMERFNFNPHQCFGNFEYDDDDKPMILQDAYGRQMDRNWRPVNGSGWLVDLQGNVIDNQGHIKFMASQLTQKGNIPNLLNYEGREFKIQSIMGIFEKDIQTKEIILGNNLAPNQKGSSQAQSGSQMDQKNQKKNNMNQLKIKSQDLRGRRVNSKGYLLDDSGNIVDKTGKIIWRSHELLYNEPPKIFNFTEFSINWIRGLLDHKIAEGHVHSEEVDNDQRRINSLGYLVNEQGDIIDRWKNAIMFRKVLLEEYMGQESQIPFVFRSGQLKCPEDNIDRQLQMKLDRVIKHETVHLQHQNFFQY